MLILHRVHAGAHRLHLGCQVVSMADDRGKSGGASWRGGECIRLHLGRNEGVVLALDNAPHAMRRNAEVTSSWRGAAASDC